MLGSLSVPAYAVSAGTFDTGRSGSIQLSCFYNKKPISDGNLLLYRVGDMETDEGQYYFRLSNELGGARLSQTDLDRNALAGELAAHAGLKKLSSREESFGQNGTVRFENVTVGLYLLVQTKAASGYECLEPILVSMPFKDPRSGDYIYDVDATGKPALEREARPTPSPVPTPKPDPGLPKTGQLNWPVPVLAGFGILFVLVGFCLLASDLRRSRQ